MKHLLLTLMATLSLSLPQHAATHAPAPFEAQEIAHDSFTTPAGRHINIYFIRHASLVLDVDGTLIYVDPVTLYGTDFATLPKADMLLVTHSHHDHLDPAAIEALRTPDTVMLGGGDVSQHDDAFRAVHPGDTITTGPLGVTITATPAYNTTPGHMQFHPQERGDTGFILDIDGMRIYIAGDTEDIPEMASFGPLDVAFIPVNQPYTMTPAQAVSAAEMLHPRVLYPYHFGDTDLTPIVDRFRDDPAIDVRLRRLQ